MAITQFNENMNIISLLPNKPTLSATELKSEFDKAGTLIKTYLNNTVVPAVESLENSQVEVVDSLSSVESTKALSAKAGALLDANKMDKVTGISSTQIGYLTGLNSPVTTLLSGKQNKISYGTSLPQSLGDGEIFLLI